MRSSFYKTFNIIFFILFFPQKPVGKSVGKVLVNFGKTIFPQITHKDPTEFPTALFF